MSWDYGKIYQRERIESFFTILLIILILVSVTFLKNNFTKTESHINSIQQLDENINIVMQLSGGTTAVSTAITLIRGILGH